MKKKKLISTNTTLKSIWVALSQDFIAHETLNNASRKAAGLKISLLSRIKSRRTKCRMEDKYSVLKKFQLTSKASLIPNISSNSALI